MFRGVNQVNMDAKGRLTVPTRYRDEIMESCRGAVVVTIDTEERCLLVYPQPAWEDIKERSHRCRVLLPQRDGCSVC